MPTITLPTTLINTAVADATEVMGDFNEIVNEYNATIGGLSGDVVTTTEIQTLTNKTLTAPTTTGADTGTATLSNKRVNKRVTQVIDSATPTPNADTDDEYNLTGLAQAATFGIPSGTPINGQTLVIRILDNGTPRALSFNAIYRAVGVSMPTTTVTSKTLYLGCIYNSASTKWDVLAVGQEA